MEKAGASEIEEVDGVLRRDFSWVVGGTVLGLGATTLDVDRLAALLLTGPTASTMAPIGAAGAAVIEQATALFRPWNLSKGRGQIQAALAMA